METEDLTMEEKCENLMNVVVESRRRFGKMCVDYNQKSSVMENNLLNLQLKTISKNRFKSKNQFVNMEVDEMFEDIDDFTKEIVERKKRIDCLRKRLKDTESIVLQLKGDSVGKKVHQPLKAEALLKLAKEKMAQKNDN